CNVQALTLTTANGFFKWIPNLQVFALIESQIFQHFHYALLNFSFGKVRKAELGVVVEVLVNGEFFNKQVILRNVPDYALYLFFFFENIEAVDEYFAFGRRNKACQYV